jgi:hypothetical protein
MATPVLLLLSALRIMSRTGSVVVAAQSLLADIAAGEMLLLDAALVADAPLATKEHMLAASFRRDTRSSMRLVRSGHSDREPQLLTRARPPGESALSAMIE